MKIFYLEFFVNEIFSVKKFPNYGIYVALVHTSPGIATSVAQISKIITTFNY